MVGVGIARVLLFGFLTRAMGASVEHLGLFPTFLDFLAQSTDFGVVTHKRKVKGNGIFFNMGERNTAIRSQVVGNFTDLPAREQNHRDA